MLFGQLDSEKLAEEKLICRQIVNEIGNFGITERQRLAIIHMLSLELEDVEAMQAISALVRELGSDSLFIVDRAESV